ncbi:endonuclease V [Deinococcus sp. AJ005]|uniref:endonuclease V n=1 Tax=Deinococcus sp. AJ005 TaxID=2652443 RepID=UPI00125CC6F7|nr:endonuclease V [Deinococcus sp. AJ005]QFP75401.1 endonuclease V [Deinococcus sp. AJ005]
MLICTDVDYRPDGTARAAGVLFREWTDATPTWELVVPVPQVEPYQPGEFYRRELPCLLALLEGAAQVHTLDAVVIDGYVTLDAGGRAGLGAHLFAALNQQVPVIGVAKTAFQGSGHALAVTRGGSLNPLFVTAAGTDIAQAAAQIARMAGPHRLPTLLKRADTLCRSKKLLENAGER